MRPVAVLAVLAACAPAEPPAEPGDLGPTGLLALPERGRQLPSERYDLDAGREVTRCWHVNLKNAEPLDVVRFETAQLPGLHHFNIFASTLARDDGWGRCPNSDELFVGARPVVDGSGSEVDYRFPEGIGVRLEPQTLLIFQLHFINAGAGPKPMQYVLNLHTAAAPLAELADIYGYTNFEILIPPNGRADAVKDCAVYERMRLLTMSAHFHRRGKTARASLLRGGQEQPLYETDDWAHPRVTHFPEPLFVGEGDTIRFVCSYENPDPVEVRYGASADDEMCFVFGYYYPKVGLVPCF